MAKVSFNAREPGSARTAAYLLASMSLSPEGCPALNETGYPALFAPRQPWNSYRRSRSLGNRALAGTRVSRDNSNLS